MSEPIADWPLLVVGAGPCGLGVGVAARLANLRCVLVDKASVVWAITNYPTHMTFFSTAERLELGGVPFTTVADKPSRREALKYYQRIVRHFQLDVRTYERVQAIEQTPAGFRVHTQKTTGQVNSHGARNVVIATGYLDTPCLLNVPGEDLAKVTHYYREGSPYFEQDCLVVGGGNSAVDAALDLYRWGARVTLVHFGQTLDAGVKPWILPDIASRIRNGEIRARFGTRIAAIQPASVLLQSEQTGQMDEIANDWVFAMTGYRPDPTLLASLGVEIDEQTGIPCFDPATMQTQQAGVYIAGVMAAGFNANKIFIENGREHGPKIVSSVLERLRGAAD
jgi:thioredoxin reductase (NADPH)